MTDVVAIQLLFLIKLAVVLVDARTEVVRIAAEGDIQGFPLKMSASIK